MIFDVPSNDAILLSYALTGLASVIAAIGSAVSAVISAKNSRKIDEVHKATNGMKDALVKANGDKMYAKGVLQGEDNPRARTIKKRTKRVVRKKRKKNV